MNPPMTWMPALPSSTSQERRTTNDVTKSKKSEEDDALDFADVGHGIFDYTHSPRTTSSETQIARFAPKVRVAFLTMMDRCH